MTLPCKYIIVLGIVIIALLGATLFLFYEPLLLPIGDFLVVQDELRSADVIHIIAGSDYRTEYAIRLFKQGFGKQIFFTGGWCTIHNYYHGQHGLALAEKEGISRGAIAIDDTLVTSTYAEAIRLKEFIARSPVPINSVIVVSDPYHMRRARWTFREILGNEIEIQMAPVPFELTPYQRRWWSDDMSQKMVRDEYMKTLYYYTRYRFSWGLVRKWLASFDRY